jgi:hypothetical protein
MTKSLAVQCDGWTPWTPGFSPKDHAEALRVLQIEQERRDHDLRLAELTHRVQEDSLKIARATERTAKLSHDFTRRWTLVFAVFAILTFVMQAFYPDGIGIPETISWIRGICGC